MKTVLFINPPSLPLSYVENILSCKIAKRDQIIAMPMGLLYLSAQILLECANVDVRIVDFSKIISNLSNQKNRTPTSFSDVINKSFDAELGSDFSPVYIGISILFSSAHHSSGLIAAICKQRWPTAPVVVGGMHATNAVEEMLKFSVIDYVCRGEGETIIGDLTRSMCDISSDPEDIYGIVGRGKMAKNPQKSLFELTPFVEDLNSLPFPAWHLLDMPNYLESTFNRARKIGVDSKRKGATIVSSRGCPFRCTFCSGWTVHGRKVRSRTIENIIAEIEQLVKKYDINQLCPEDDMFTSRKGGVRDLANAVRKCFGDKLHFQFPSGLSVAMMDEDVMDAIIDLGATVINLAIESGSKYVQSQLIKKNCDLDRARWVAQRFREKCKDKDSVIRAFFILGFPGETKSLMEESIRYASELPIDWCVFGSATPLVGTEMFQRWRDDGVLGDDYNWDGAMFSERTFDTPEASASELMDIAYAANINVNFFNSYNMRNGHFDRAQMMFEDILQAYPGHLIAQYCIGQAHKNAGRKAEYENAMNRCHQLIENKHPLTLHHIVKFHSQMPDLHLSEFAKSIKEDFHEM
jgi:magnesium-protoporphyrin IX monomethyl ester (oxidative) cyclase